SSTRRLCAASDPEIEAVSAIKSDAKVWAFEADRENSCYWLSWGFQPDACYHLPTISVVATMPRRPSQFDIVSLRCAGSAPLRMEASGLSLRRLGERQDGICSGRIGHEPADVAPWVAPLVQRARDPES